VFNLGKCSAFGGRTARSPWNHARFPFFTPSAAGQLGYFTSFWA